MDHSIPTFKAHFLYIRAGVSLDYPHNLWGLLLLQIESTLNLLRQATFDPTISSWGYFQGPFNYNATPLRPLGCNFITHNRISTLNSWEFCGAAVWNIGVSLKHYCCQNIFSKATKATQILDTIEFRHHRLTLPSLTLEDCITHGINKLTCSLQEAPDIVCDNQLAAVESLRQVFHQWTGLNV